MSHQTLRLLSNESYTSKDVINCFLNYLAYRNNTSYMKKSAQRRRKHACWLYTKAEPKIFDSPHFTGALDGQNLGHYFHLQIKFGEDRCTQFRVIVVTDPQTNTQTDRGDNNTLRSLARSVNIDMC